jgi:hypothetical protein
MFNRANERSNSWSLDGVSKERGEKKKEGLPSLLDCLIITPSLEAFLHLVASG